MIQVKDHLNLLSAQYLVHCLDTENVCHHITRMDNPPRELKETIFTRHNQTVLQLLANNKKDTIQVIHTPFVNRAIDNMTDNRVYSTIDIHLSMTRKPIYRDDNGKLYHNSAPDIANFRIPIKSELANLFFKLSRLWNRSIGCTSPVQ